MDFLGVLVVEEVKDDLMMVVLMVNGVRKVMERMIIIMGIFVFMVIFGCSRYDNSFSYLGLGVVVCKMSIWRVMRIILWCNFYKECK